MTSYDTILYRLIETINNIVPDMSEHNIQPSDSLKTLGVNSIDRVDILVETMEVLTISLPLTAFSHAKNIGELANIMYHAKEA